MLPLRPRDVPVFAAIAYCFLRFAFPFLTDATQNRCGRFTVNPAGSQIVHTDDALTAAAADWSGAAAVKVAASELDWLEEPVA